MQGIGDVSAAGLLRTSLFRVLSAALLTLIAPQVADALDAAPAETAAPGEAFQPRGRFEWGPMFALPVPGGSAHPRVLGLDAGLSCTAPMKPWYMGVGVDAAYHYWPVSSEFKRGFNDHLRRQTLNTLELGGETWGMQVIHLGFHVRAVWPPEGTVRSWLRLGAGSYMVNPNTTGYSGDAGFFTVSAQPLERTAHMGWSVTVGADLLHRPHARAGLGSTYHVVHTRERYGENLRVLTLGAHVSFSP